MVTTANSSGVSPKGGVAAADFAWFEAGLARAGATPEDSSGLDHAVPILRHLVLGEERDTFCEEVIARVRGMLDDVARQLAQALAEAGGQSAIGAGPEAVRTQVLLADTRTFAALLAANGAFLSALHAQALEWQLALRLEQDHGIDMVLSPAIEAAIGSGDADRSSAAMAVLVAQARFCQTQRRMQLPLGELPQDLFRIALQTLHVHAHDRPEAQSRAIIAERSLRLRFDAERGRLGLLRRFVDDHAGDAGVLDPAGAGSAVFLTGLGRVLGAPREEAVLLTVASQVARLALVLRAAGLPGDVARSHVQLLHPDIAVPSSLAVLLPEQAGALLARNGLGA